MSVSNVTILAGVFVATGSLWVWELFLVVIVISYYVPLLAG